MSRPLTAATLLLLASCQPAPKPAEEPAAAVMDWPATEGGPMTELRPGTSSWVCMPDVPSSPGVDPMCFDASGLKWAAAWQGKTRPQLDGLGFAYMLQGGSDASNTDPYATGPSPGSSWVETGPHVMIFPTDPASLKSMSVDYQTGGPYVMWQGTPYAHVMLPVK